MSNSPHMKSSNFRAMGMAKALGAVFLVLGTLMAIPAAAASPAYLRIPCKAQGSSQQLAIEVNKSILVDLPTNAGEVIVGQPGIATVVMRSKTRAIVQGVS